MGYSNNLIHKYPVINPDRLGLSKLSSVKYWKIVLNIISFKPYIGKGKQADNRSKFVCFFFRGRGQQ